MKMMLSFGMCGAVDRRRFLAPFLALVITLTAVGETNTSPRLKTDDTPLAREVKARTSFAPVIKKVSPSVVNIYSTMIVRGRSSRGLFGDDPMLRRFFGDDSDNEKKPRPHKEQSLGSGAVVSPDGYILTANHVVEGADKVKVSFGLGEREFDAKIIGTDPPTDIAVLKIDAKDLPVLVIADSDKLEVGDTVLAVGNPFELGRTVTMGIVSGTGRGGFGINIYEDFIQTDAAINMGNSGGPLVDAQGRLVGINTMIFSRSGGFQGVGFAVPVNLARYVMDRLISDGKVARGYLGLRLESNLTPELARQLNLPDTSGALVTSVEPASPASKAGLKDEDFVIEFNGKKVSDMRQLRLMVSQTSPGTKAGLKIVRNGKDKSLTVTVGQMSDDLLTGGPRSPSGDRHQSGTDALDGVEVSDLDAKARRQFNIPTAVHGVIVGSVDEDSNSAEAGLHPGDVIVEINRQPVNSADEAITLSEKAKGDRILLRVWSSGRGGESGGMHYLSVDNTKRK